MKNNTNRQNNSWIDARGLQKAVLVLPSWTPTWDKLPEEQIDLNSKDVVFRIHIESFYKKYNSEFKHILRPEEMLRMETIQFEKARLKFVVSKTAIRVILERILGESGREFRFKRNRWGKPDLVSGKVSFNISYSDGWLLIATSLRNKVGVDVEAINKVFDYKPLVDTYFHPMEIKKLSDSFSFSQKTFFQLWTRKEALAKVIGLGLHDRLLRTNMLDESLPYQKNNSSSFFVIHSFNVDNQHIGALAMRNVVQQPTFYNFL